MKSGIIAWAGVLIVAAMLLAASAYRSRDPDSTVYAEISGRMSALPLRAWLAPEWGGSWGFSTVSRASDRHFRVAGAAGALRLSGGAGRVCGGGAVFRRIRLDGAAGCGAARNGCRSDSRPMGRADSSHRVRLSRPGQSGIPRPVPDVAGRCRNAPRSAIAGVGARLDRSGMRTCAGQRHFRRLHSGHLQSVAAVDPGRGARDVTRCRGVDRRGGRRAGGDRHCVRL